MSRSKVIQVIETGSLRPVDGGLGGQKHVVEYWSLEGRLLAECDPENLPFGMREGTEE